MAEPMKQGAVGGGGVDRVDVRGKVDGVQLEAGDSVTPPPDSIPAPGSRGAR